MPSGEQQKAPPKAPALIALVGAACCAVLWPTVAGWEGNKQVPYRDIVGIWTVCRGDTQNVVPGQAQTEQQCDARFERQLIAHAKPVMQCVPGLKDRPNALAASVSLTYNIGTAAFCRSTAAKRFNAGDWRGGCDAFLAWRFAGGREVKGLLNRRRAEREICLRGGA